MSKTIDYYLSPMSPWAYLGHAPFQTITNKLGSNINIRPIDPGKLFAATGGVPVAQRPIQRQKYRISELKRWKSALKSPIEIEPQFFPYNPALISLVTAVVVSQFDTDKAMEVILRFMEGCWVENRDMGSPDEIKKSLETCDLDGSLILQTASKEEASKALEENTQRAIDADVFGVPSYVIEGEVYWGQDRLNFLEDHLSS